MACRCRSKCSNVNDQPQGIHVQPDQLRTDAHLQHAAPARKGRSRPIQTPFQVTNCVGLGFNPQLRSLDSGSDLPGRRREPGCQADLSARQKARERQERRVELPKQLPSRLTTLQQACPDHVFGENPESCCPAPRGSGRRGRARRCCPTPGRLGLLRLARRRCVPEPGGRAAGSS